MKILGMNISKINASRKNPIKGQLNIKSDIDIKNIEKPINAKNASKISSSMSILSV